MNDAANRSGQSAASSRRWSVCAVVSSLIGSAIFCLPAHPQTTKDPLTDAQVDQVRETGDQPVQRVKLYMKFIDQRTSEIHKIVADPRTPSANVQIHNLMEEFTRLADELQDNLETYQDTHPDLRKALKELVEHSDKWNGALQEPKASADYDFARKTALDTAQSTNDMAKKMLADQEQYFSTHKPPK